MAGRGGRTIGEDLPPGHYTFAGLSELTQVPVDTLRRWFKAGRFHEYGTTKHGKLTVHVFDDDTVEEVRKIREEGSNSE